MSETVETFSPPLSRFRIKWKKPKSPTLAELNRRFNANREKFMAAARRNCMRLTGRESL